MRIGVVGGGPSGLYFAYLMKRLDPDAAITVVEQNPKSATYGFGVVFSDKALTYLEAGDPRSFEIVSGAMETWPDLTIVQKDERVPIDGNGFSAIARLKLLNLLQGLCEEVGVRIEYESPLASLDRFQGFDLIVGADGANSLVRQFYADAFRPEISCLTNKFVWYGTAQVFDTLTLTFREHDGGAYVAHHYRYSPTMSTFIVECDAATWDRAGFAHMSDEESRTYCERIFAPDLGGHHLVSNKSIWRNFPVVTNRHWRRGNVVLIGDALRTVHFSIGSGTRLALEDAIVLRDAFAASGPDVPAALEQFEATRRPTVEKLLGAAANSFLWYESFAAKIHLDAPALAYDYMTRSGRVDDMRLRAIAPRFMTVYDRWRSQGGRT
ncbi:MAG TPA: FAD-dependent monooxygenase [Alphaproteobacteria bacterium]|nr:FAD-dependent monooxygenase [Alphaproteobacteria bacterium]